VLSRLGSLAARHATQDPWTNVYGLGRSLAALGTLLTLAFTSTSSLFQPGSGVPVAPVCDGLAATSIFCVLGDHLELARAIGIGILAVVISGWRPRMTAIPHWWVSFSIVSTVVTIDGGDHICAVLTLLLLPIALTDPRRSHWSPPGNGAVLPSAVTPGRLTATFAWWMIRLQVAGIYLNAGVAKWSVEEWRNGTVLYYVWTDPNYGAPAWLLPILMPLLHNGPVMTALTWSVLLLELLLFASLVMDSRHWKTMLWAGLLFHGGIALIHGLISFGFAMSAALVLYLRPIGQPFAPMVFRRRRAAVSVPWPAGWPATPAARPR
jgi:antimicrobial peptide system SdpB family protein